MADHRGKGSHRLLRSTIVSALSIDKDLSAYSLIINKKKLKMLEALVDEEEEAIVAQSTNIIILQIIW